MLPADLHEDVATLRSRVLPRVQRPDGHGVVLVPDQLVIRMVAEAPDGLRLLDDRDLRTLKATEAELLPVALDNLRRRSGGDAWHPLKAVDGMLVLVAGDGQAASRMLILRDLLDPWPLGGVLVAVPTPEQLLVVPMNDLSHLSAFQVLVQSGNVAVQLGRASVTDQVFWFDGTSWAHIAVNRHGDEVDVLPPPGFLAMVEKLAALKMVGLQGEA